MSIPIDGIDINKLTDDDLRYLTGGGGKSSPSVPAGGFDIRSLSDKDVAALTQAHTSNVPTGKAAARLFYKHLTFGTQPGVSEEGRKRAEAAASEHPYLNFGTGAGAMAAQMA